MSRASTTNNDILGHPLERRLETAVAAWGQFLAPEQIRRDQATLARYAGSTMPRTTRAVAVLYPESTDQVQRIIRVSADFFLPVHAISRGRNWGYGDARPPRDGQVILDLERMNRILEVNEELAYAVIEPGVTQGQLYDHLQRHHPTLWPDSTGAGREASLVGNVLDRGFGHTRYGDHVQTACGIEVVLGDGRILRTGFTHYAHAKAGRVYRYGVGPMLDGLLQQSNVGVVTQIGLWLMPRPEDFAGFYILGREEADLERIIDRLRPLRMHGLLQSCIHVANDLRALSGRIRYPFERAGGRTPLPDDLRRRLAAEYGVGPWNASGAIYGTRATVKAVSREVSRAMRGSGCRLVVVNDRRLAAAHRIARLFSWTRAGRRLAGRLQVLEGPYSLLKGYPSDEPLRGAAWRVRDPDTPLPSDPLSVHAGLMWVSPVLPATGKAAREVMEIADPIYRHHGFETLMTFTLVTERALVGITNIAFDRRIAAECSAAAACYDELMDRLISAGYLPYRTSPEGAAKLGRGSETYWDVVRQIKQALDPNGVISPGRYGV